jgi:hypothetical protein
MLENFNWAMSGVASEGGGYYFVENKINSARILNKIK